MLFVLLVIMLMAGVGLLIQGQVKLPGKRILKRRPAQICGVILLSFLPLAFVTTLFIQELEYLIQQLVYWAIALVCLFLALIIVVRASTPTQPARTHSSATAVNPVFADVPAEDAYDSPEQPVVAPRAKAKSNPFDFS